MSNRDRDFERKAIILNFISLVACAVMAATSPMLALFIIALAFAAIEAVHFVLGDITTSYRLAAKPFFKWFSAVVAAIFFGFIAMAFFLGLPLAFFASLLIAWLTEQGANCIRLKKRNNRIKGLVSLLKQKKIKRKKKKKKKEKNLISSLT